MRVYSLSFVRVIMALIVLTNIVEASDNSNSCKILIKLKRDICYGSCPIYSVTICKNADVIYDGEDYVATKGIVKSHIDQDKIDELVERFKRANYQTLKDDYLNATITDQPTYYLSIMIDDKEKNISHNVGDPTTPKVVSDLEDLVDNIADTNRWIFKSKKTKYQWVVK